MPEWTDSARKWFGDQPNAKLMLAAMIIVGTIYIIFGSNKGPEYHENVNAEIKIATAICENSLDWVLEDRNRLKLGQGDLRDVRINGKLMKLDLVKYPKVVFMDSGIRNIKQESTATDLYCVFEDPRSSSRQYFYKYDERLWVDKVRFRR